MSRVYYSNSVLLSIHGSYYQPGNPFSHITWTRTMDIYQNELEEHGECTHCRLTDLVLVSTTTEQKAIRILIDRGNRKPCKTQRSRQYWGRIICQHGDDPPWISLAVCWNSYMSAIQVYGRCLVTSIWLITGYVHSLIYYQLWCSRLRTLMSMIVFMT